MSSEQELLTEKEAAEVLRKSESWLCKLRLYGPEGSRPPVHYVGRKPLYDRDSLLEWVRSGAAGEVDQ